MTGGKLTQSVRVSVNDLLVRLAAQSVDDLHALLHSSGDGRVQIGSELGDIGAELVVEDGSGDGDTDDTADELDEVDQRGGLRNHLGLVGVFGLDGDDDVLKGTSDTDTKEDLEAVHLGGGRAVGEGPEDHGGAQSSDRRGGEEEGPWATSLVDDASSDTSTNDGGDHVREDVDARAGGGVLLCRLVVQREVVSGAEEDEHDEELGKDVKSASAQESYGDRTYGFEAASNLSEALEHLQGHHSFVALPPL